MKKITSAFTVILIALLIVGCDNKSTKELKELQLNLTEEIDINESGASAVCQIDTDMNTNKKIVTGAKFVIFSENDIVTRVEGTELAESHDATTIRDMRNNIEDNYALVSEKYGGYDYTVKLEGIRLTVTTSIDYSKVNFEQWVTDNPDLAEFLTKDYKYELRSIIQMYEASGLECILK